MPIVPITHFKGLHNKGPSLRLPPGSLTVANNVNVLDTGAIEVRAGYERATTMTLSGAFATEDESRLYVVDAGVLKVVHPDMSSTDLAQVGPGEVLWAQLNEQVLFATASSSGIIHHDHQVFPWAWDVPAMPMLQAVSGHMDAGQYGVLLVHVLPDGRTTGAGLEQYIELQAGQGLHITAPQPPTGIRQLAYVCPANSTVYQLAGELRAGSLTWDASANALGRELTKFALDPLPQGAVAIAVWRSRACVAVLMEQQAQSVVFSSEPMAPHLFDMAEFFMVPGKVTMLAAHPSALLVGTESAIYAYGADGVLAKLADYGVVPGSPHALDGARLLFWSKRGVCQFPEFKCLTDRAVSVAPGVRAGACVVQDNGQSRLVVALQKGGEAHNPRITR